MTGALFVDRALILRQGSGAQQSSLSQERIHTWSLPPAALFNSSSERSVVPLGGAGSKEVRELVSFFIH
ncbi:MAG: hypothetical protein CBC35_00315 [Planctomycetes bacterium TMED75]|nr:hypothetical protein [Planctomycetaceae bacterium]OUU96894.1 MAG: hypothetical protein CBC35_00315 [Planctomycetes bacterium TMED75]